MELWVTSKVICQADTRVAVQIMVPERREYTNVLLPPGGGFVVIDLPIIGIVAVVSDVATNGHEVRMRIGDGFDQVAPRLGIGSIRINRIGEARVAIGNEVHTLAVIQVYS